MSLLCLSFILLHVTPDVGTGRSPLLRVRLSEGPGRVRRKLVGYRPPPFTVVDKEEHVSATHVYRFAAEIKRHVEVVRNDGSVAVGLNGGRDLWR